MSSCLQTILFETLYSVEYLKTEATVEQQLAAEKRKRWRRSIKFEFVKLCRSLGNKSGAARKFKEKYNFELNSRLAIAGLTKNSSFLLRGVDMEEVEVAGNPVIQIWKKPNTY